jgi:hypothetical protein
MKGNGDSIPIAVTIIYMGGRYRVGYLPKSAAVPVSPRIVDYRNTVLGGAQTTLQLRRESSLPATQTQKSGLSSGEDQFRALTQQFRQRVWRATGFLERQ